MFSIDGLRIIGALGIFAGLVLVAVELRQSALLVRAYFGNAYAQAWWRQNNARYGEALVAIMDPIISGLPMDRDLTEFDSLRAEAADKVAVPAPQAQCSLIANWRLK